MYVHVKRAKKNYPTTHDMGEGVWKVRVHVEGEGVCGR